MPVANRWSSEPVCVVCLVRMKRRRGERREVREGPKEAAVGDKRTRTSAAAAAGGGKGRWTRGGEAGRGESETCGKLS